MDQELFKTDVTWEDIHNDMQAVLSTSATFGPNRTISNIGDGKGFLSKIGLLYPDWQGSDVSALPAKFVVKVCTPVNLLNYMESANGSEGDSNVEEKQKEVDTLKEHVAKLHNLEVMVYEVLSRQGVPDLPRPKVYFAQRFTATNKTKGYIIMDIIENLSPVAIWDNLSINEARKIMRAIAALQAVSVRLLPEDLSNFPLNLYSDLVGIFFKPECAAIYCEQARKFDPENSWGVWKKFDQMVTTMLSPEYMNAMDNLADRIGMKRVLAHGDLSVMNCLWRRSNDGYDLAAVVDYQNTHLGGPSADLARVLCQIFDGPSRRKYTEQMLEEFYKMLVEIIGDIDLIPYSFDQLKAAYKKTFPMAGFVSIAMAGGVAQHLIENKNDENKKLLENLSSKVHYLVEDMLEWSEPVSE